MPPINPFTRKSLRELSWFPALLLLHEQLLPHAIVVVFYFEKCLFKKNNEGAFSIVVSSMQ
ncbi:hypothetical protein, partial [Serratia marcescens]|uniref:hypothetical protein n=1 Tax=Serratia marcescens TaxID=615 RepID=UPI0019549847